MALFDPAMRLFRPAKSLISGFSPAPEAASGPASGTAADPTADKAGPPSTAKPTVPARSPGPATRAMGPPLPESAPSISAELCSSEVAPAGEQAADKALVEAAQGGDFGAFESLVQRHHDRVFRLVQGMVKNPMDAEEVVQETFLNVFRHLQTFHFDSTPKTWILRIAVNAALMRLRSQRRKPLLALEDHRAGSEARGDQPFWAPSPWSCLPDAAMLSQELRQTIDLAVQRLPEKYRLVLLLRDVEEHSNDEVAHALGLTVPTVKSRLHRARLFVRQRLDDYFTAH